jgi:hypothetical protein
MKLNISARSSLGKVLPGKISYIINNHIYKALNWQRLSVLRQFHILCIVFKAIHCLNFPIYLKKLFVSLSESHGRTTRSKNNLILKLPKYKLNAFKFSFVCTAIRLWNSLHVSIRSATSLNQFKARYSAKYFE